MVAAKRRCLVIIVLTFLTVTTSEAQRYTTFTIPDSAIIFARPGRCSIEFKDLDFGTDVAFDTVGVVVTDAAKKPRKSPVALDLLVDGSVVQSWSVADSVRKVATGARIHERSTLAVRRSDIDNPLCVAGPQLLRIAADSGDSWVILSLIKSISGLVPPNELFELRLRFGGGFPQVSPEASDSAIVQRAKARAIGRLRNSRGEPISPVPPGIDARALARARSYSDSAEAAGWKHFAPFSVRGPLRRWFGRYVSGQRLFTMATADVNLATQVDTAQKDTTKRFGVPDGSFSLNYIASIDRRVDRMGFATAMFKIFNARNYVGAGYGGIELAGSRLYGTMLTVSYLYGLYRDTVSVAQKTAAGADTVVQKELYNRHNVLLEFYVRAPGLNLLDRLRIRGGLLFPFGRTPAGLYRARPESRIAVSVPIVDLTPFR